MKVESQHDYPLAASELIHLLTQKDYYQQRYHIDEPAPDSGFREWQETAEGLCICLVKKVPIKVENLPSALRRFVSSEMDLSIRFFWHGIEAGKAAHQAEVDCEMSLGKAPLDVSGRMRISEEAGKARQKWLLELSCSIPLLGRKLLEKAAPKVEELLQDEYQATLDYISARA